MKLNSPGFRLAALATTSVLLLATPSAIAAVKSFKAHSLVNAKIKIVKSSSSLRAVTATTVTHVDATATPTVAPTPTPTVVPTPTIAPSPMPSISSATNADQEAGDENESDDNASDNNVSDDTELAVTLAIGVGDHEQD